MLALVENIKNTTQLRFHRVHKFQKKISLNIELGAYIIKTAETSDELIESFRLRHEVFHQEFQGVLKPGLDFDKFDYHFDHLIIIHKETSKIIGTYRLHCSEYLKNSYTGLEFDLSHFSAEQGPYLELGRACIQKQFRKGAVISLLWRGIAEYMNLSKANILFGCSSLKINNPREAALVFKYLQMQEFVKNDFLTRPTKNFSMKNFDAWYVYFSNKMNTQQVTEAEALLPSLLKSYLKLGAKVACEPAFDKDFDCIDLLTVLKKENLVNSLAEKFNVAR